MPVSRGNHIVTKELRNKYQQTYRSTHRVEYNLYLNIYRQKHRDWKKVKKEFLNILIDLIQQ